jgi:hypothetical protein
MRCKNVECGKQIPEADRQQRAGEQRAHAGGQFLKMVVQAVDGLIIHVHKAPWSGGLTPDPDFWFEPKTLIDYFSDA